ncbi:hypothetical protein [Mesorhizobium sp. WSM2239]|uniref:Uncharacterized protein n=1 Tax=Mesorhizobium sp. WSM2239 TaxID=3228852 RepID=A0AAU8DHM8_9HYPH
MRAACIGHQRLIRPSEWRAVDAIIALH